MYINQSRAVSNANILQSTASLRSIDAYDNYERQQSRRASRAANRNLENQYMPSTNRSNISMENMRQQAILNSNLDYPSETNRGKIRKKSNLFTSSCLNLFDAVFCVVDFFLPSFAVRLVLFYFYLYSLTLEIYSTYLVDSVRPHYSARRMINGKSGNIQFYNRPSMYDNSGDSVDPFLLKSRLLTKRPSQNAEKLDDYEFIL